MFSEMSCTIDTRVSICNSESTIVCSYQKLGLIQYNLLRANLVMLWKISLPQYLAINGYIRDNHLYKLQL